MHARIEYYRRNRSALSPSRSPSPSRKNTRLGSGSNSSRDKAIKSTTASSAQRRSSPDGENKSRRTKGPVIVHSGTSIDNTAASVRSHILVEQKKLEKNIIKLTHLKSMRDKNKARLREIKTKKRMERQQMLSGSSDAVEKSTVSIRISVLTARNLPEMKRRTHSADPFVELWVKPTTSTSPMPDEYVDKPMLRYSTAIKWGMLFPRWEESFDLSVPCEYDCRDDSGNPNGNVSISDDCLRIVLRDAVKSDIASNEGTNLQSLIGECFLNFDLLLDQKVHTVWLPVVDTVVATPELHYLHRSRHKLPPDCALKVQARLLYSKEILLRNRISDADRQILNLSRHVDECSNELLALAYEWEQIQEKQRQLEALTAGPTQKSKSSQRRSDSKQRVSLGANSTIEAGNLRKSKQAISFDDFVSQQSGFVNPDEGSVPAHVSKDYDEYENNSSPVVKLERREDEDILLLSRSNSNIEFGTNIMNAGIRKVTAETETKDHSGHISQDNLSQAEMGQVKIAERKPVSYEGFINNKANPIDETESVEESNRWVADSDDGVGHKENISKPKAPNMSIFRGAGGGRVSFILWFPILCFYYLSIYI